MASETQDIARALGQLEGRATEQSSRLDELTTAVRQVNTVGEGFRQVNTDMGEGFRQVNTDMASGLQQVNDRIDRLLLTVLAIGGGIIAALVGLIITLILRA